MAVREFSVVTAIETMALAALEPYELEAVIPPNGIPELKVYVVCVCVCRRLVCVRVFREWGV